MAMPTPVLSRLSSALIPKFQQFRVVLSVGEIRLIDPLLRDWRTETRQSFRARRDLIHQSPGVHAFEKGVLHTRSEWNSLLEEADYRGKVRLSLVADTTKIFFWTSTYVGC
jgi:hypothetical protein